MSKFPSTPLIELKAPGRYSMVGGPFGSKLVSRDYVESGVPVIRGGNLPFGSRFSFEDMVYVTEGKVEADLAGNLAYPGDIVVTQRGTLGQVGLIPEDSPHPKFVVSQSQMKLTVDRSKADPLFVYYVLKSPVGQHEIHSRAITAGVPHINLALFQRLQVPMPPLPIQLKIVAILSAYDDLIENNNRRIKLLEETARRIYRDWFVDFRYPGHEAVPLVSSEFGPIPRGWDWKQLRDIATEIRISVDPGAIDPDTPYVGLEHMPERSIALCEWGTAQSAGSRKFKFVAGDVLFGKIRPYFHKVSVAPIDGICSTDAVVVRSRTPDVYGVMVSVISSDAFVAEAVQSSQGTKMPRANWGVLEKYPVAIPPQALLERFNIFASDTVSLIHRMVNANRNLRSTRDLLLPRLISGDVDVTELNIAVPKAAA